MHGHGPLVDVQSDLNKGSGARGGTNGLTCIQQVLTVNYRGFTGLEPVLPGLEPSVLNKCGPGPGKTILYNQ